MQIDLNADLGEGGAFDQQLLTLVSSANISCGAHAGNTETMIAAIQGARANNVTIGAHPGYPDRENFGRLAVRLSTMQLRETVYSQLAALQRLVHAEGLKLTHVKPHGALYNQAAIDIDLADKLVSIIKDFDAGLAIVGLAGSQLLTAASKAGMASKAEAFADRAYAANGTLLSRTDPRALIQDPQQAVDQTLALINTGSVTAIDGSMIKLHADTICIHGDTPHALVFARQLHQALSHAGISISSADLLK
jgi:UPF0271 protein